MKSTPLLNCSVPLCKSVKLLLDEVLAFPKDEELAKRWSRILKIQEADSKYAHVCYRHFKEKDFLSSNKHTGKQRLKKKAVPSMNLPPSSITTPSLKKCFVKLSPLPLNKLTKVYPSFKIKNILKTTTRHKNKINGNSKQNGVNKARKKKLNDESLEKLLNQPFSQENNNCCQPSLILYNSSQQNPILTNCSQYLPEISKLNQMPSIENMNAEKTVIKGILKTKSSKQNSKPKKVKFKTKLGQFRPGKHKKIVIRDQIKTNKEVIKYEVVEQLNDCNVLILKM